MGQHKVPGASKGPDYRKEQHLGSRFITLHSKGAHAIGSVFQMLDGKKYVVTQDGSYRRIEPKGGNSGR
jgi:hypothetical protein